MSRADTHTNRDRQLNSPPLSSGKAFSTVRTGGRRRQLHLKLFHLCRMFLGLVCACRSGGLPGLGGLEGLDGGGPSPQQLAAMLQAMPEQQRNQVSITAPALLLCLSGGV